MDALGKDLDLNKKEEFSFKNFFVPLTTLKAIHLIIIVGILVLGSCLLNSFVGDDATQVSDNPLVHSLANIPYIFSGSTFDFGGVTNSGLYYKPMMSLVITFIYVIFGNNAWPFHLVQVCIHIINAILVFLILRYFLNRYITAFLALVFLVHPVNIETVAYISDLQDVLFFFFGGLALLLELQRNERTIKNYLIAFFLLLSLFSKETGVLFMATILMYEFIYFKNRVKLSLLLDTLVLGIYALFRIGLAHITFYKDSASPIMNVSFGERMLNVPVILLYYFKAAFFPLHLAVAQEWVMSSKDFVTVFLSTIMLLLILATIAWLGKTIYSKHKNYFAPYIFFVFIFSSGLLFHAQLFFTLDSTVEDRWLYFPLIGLLGIIGVLLQIYLKKIWPLSKSFLIIIALSILIILSIRSIVRIPNFHDDYTLSSHDIKYSPDSSLLNSLLGLQLLNQGQFIQAGPYLLKSVQLDPKGQVVWNTLGLYYEAIGQPEKAEQAYINSINNGANLEAYYNLALYYFVNNQPQSAEKIAHDGLQKFPYNGQLWQLYALIENSLGHAAVALDAAKHAAVYYPDNISTVMYNRLLYNLPVSTKIVPTSGKSKKLDICLPNCQ